MPAGNNAWFEPKQLRSLGFLIVRVSHYPSGARTYYVLVWHRFQGIVCALMIGKIVRNVVYTGASKLLVVVAAKVLGSWLFSKIQRGRGVLGANPKTISSEKPRALSI